MYKDLPLLLKGSAPSSQVVDQWISNGPQLNPIDPRPLLSSGAVDFRAISGDLV